MTNNQREAWNSDFGREYTERNPHNAAEVDELYLKKYGLTRTDLNERFLTNIDNDSRVLEVGCNVGAQLDVLRQQGFEELYGVDVQRYAIEQAHRKHPKLNIIKGGAGDIPFKDDFFDLVFTSGVLIHISPNHLQTVIEEICRCTRRYIWGFEYYSPDHSEIGYRGRDNLLWKGDFVHKYEKFGELRVLNRERIDYLDNDNLNEMFLIEVE